MLLRTNAWHYLLEVSQSVDSHGPLLFLLFLLPPPPLPPFPSPLALSISHVLWYVKIDGASRHLRSLICIFCIFTKLFAVFSFLALWCHHLPGNPTCGSTFQALVFPGCGWAAAADFIATLVRLKLPPSSWFPILHVDSASFTSFWGFGENNPIQNQFISRIDRVTCWQPDLGNWAVIRLILSFMKKNLAQHFKVWKN